MAGGLQPYGGGKVPRRKSDLYPTHPSAPEAFHAVEAGRMRAWGDTVFEPACGPGLLARVFEAHGFGVVASDLFPYGYGEAGRDFLDCHQAPCAVLVTNPPYGPLAEAFIRHAVLTLRIPYVAMLLKATYWHAGSRRDLFAARPPSVIYPLGWRLHWDGRGRPVQEFAWNVWDVARRPRGMFANYAQALPRPTDWPDVGFDEWLRGAGLSVGLEDVEEGGE